MTSWKKYVLAVMIVTAAGFAYVNNSHRNIPSDIRDAVADDVKSRDFDTTIPAIEKGKGNVPVPEVVPGEHGRGYVAANDPSAGAPSVPIEWVTIPGGKFAMGTDSGEKGFEDAKPVHEVTIKTFDMSKTLVTVEQYAECVIKGGCTEPATGDYCNWGVTGRQFHPVNCVEWDQASEYAKFKGARLPSESEWEYAATSGGKNQKYPWGNDKPTCDKAVMYGNGGYGCGARSTMPVCSKTAGNSAQGLCDMAGNVWQWVQDKYRNSYKGAPVDGSAFEEAEGSYWVVRGGSFYADDFRLVRADYRFSHGYGVPGGRFGFGFRLAR